MGRLENIIARNRKGNRPKEPLIVSTFIGAVILLILFLSVFTDLGKPKEPPPARHDRADGILLIQRR